MIIKGFSYAATMAGIRKKDRLDLGLIFCEIPAVAAGVFTTNRVAAAPVLLGRRHLRSGRVQAVLVNSGIANACTGEPGMAAARSCGRSAAAVLGIAEELVQVSSTGVIGVQLDPARFEAALPALVENLAPDKADQVARAMMTTDTVPKTVGRELVIGGRTIKIFGMAKGAGMIMPDMATMLCFVMTDAVITAEALDQLLRPGVDCSFNKITVDGDTSTNDTVLMLANGRAGNPEIRDAGSGGGRAFAIALTELLRDLALQIVADGEGATKLVTIRVQGAIDDTDAEKGARTIGNSALVKTAFFGEDANWGRIIGALGRAGIELDPNRVSIGFDDVPMVRAGLGLGPEQETKATAVLKQKKFTVTIDLGLGPGNCEIHTCDLSLDYVRINADYRT